jgi:spore germination protein GerM
VAARRPIKKNTQKSSSQIIVIFWLVFVIVIITVFMINAQTIQKNFNLFMSRLTAGSAAEEELLTADDEIGIIEQSTGTEPEIVIIEPSPGQTETLPAATEEKLPDQSSQSQPVQTRERVIYFTRIDNDGQILQSRIVRRLPASETPMQDVLNVMLTGPTAEELTRGIINFIPQNTRLLSATIRGNTAYINFSEDFMFNTFGVEGYVAQLRQIVWTVTEFPNVNDVQILIDGRRLDYLGEGIWIGSPINRQSF